MSKLGRKKTQPSTGANRWRRKAWEFAREAYFANYQSRRGCFPLRTPAECLMVLYNNNPYAFGPHIRDGETRKLRQWLAERGFAEVAYATYPSRGEEAGHSYAMILDVPEEQHREVAEKIRELVAESLDQMEQEGRARQPPFGCVFKVIEGGLR